MKTRGSGPPVIKRAKKIRHIASDVAWRMCHPPRKNSPFPMTRRGGWHLIYSSNREVKKGSDDIYLLRHGGFVINFSMDLKFRRGSNTSYPYLFYLSNTNINQYIRT
jgi:hypothetical protein